MPTRGAELLYGHARRILEMVEEAQRAVDAFLGRLRGELLVGGSTTPGQYVLPEFIGRFRTMHPEVRVTLVVGLVGAVIDDDRLAILDDLAAGRVIELDLEGLDLKRQFHLVTRKKRTHSPAALPAAA